MPLRSLPNHALRALGLCLALYGASAQAQQPLNISVGEMALLPAYCPESQGFAHGGFPQGPLPTQVPWIARMGPDFWAIHHYCWALINANRSTLAGVSRKQRDHLLMRAIDDCEYVIRNSQPGFVLRPEIFLRIGEYMERMERYAEAADRYALAWRTKADYWPAYLRGAKLQARMGNRAAAVEILETGLQQLPDHEELGALLASLKAPEPRPRSARPAEPAASSARR